MEQESTPKLLSIKNRPSAARDPMPFIGSFEGEFDRQQAEPSATPSLQREVGRIQKIEIVDLPRFRLDDAPPTDEPTLCRSSCRHTIHALSPMNYAERSPGTN